MQQSPLARARQNGQKGRDLGSLRLLPPLVGPHKAKFGLGLVAVLLAGGCVLALGQVFQHLVDKGLAHNGNIQALHQGLLQLLALVVILAVASYGRLVLLTGTAEQMMAELKQKMLAKLLHLDMAWFERQKTGDLMARMTNDISLLQVLFGTSLPVALRNALLVVGGLVMMAMSSLVLSGMVLLLVPVILVILYMLGPSVRQRGKLLQERIGLVGAHLNESLTAIHEIQAFTREQDKEGEFAAVNARAVDAAWSYVGRRGLLSSLIILVVFASIAGLLWVGGKQVLGGVLTPGQLSAFVFYALLVAGSVGTLSEIYGDLLRAAGALERLDEVLSTVPKIQPVSPLAALSQPVTGRLQLEAVSFSYESRPDARALDQIDLTFNPGEITAIVGPSGSGKTTLFNLLLRFYDPSLGRILFDGIDIRHLDPKTYRRHFSLVPQDPTLFSASIRDNIAFNAPDIVQDAIIAAAQKAGADGFITGFPDGYDTLLGERGTRLSGGQAQRIALARALLRDPLVLLLDEATAHLDSETESAVHDALRFNRQNRTTLIIAHRLSTIQHADRILVLEHGKLVASGTHETLLESSDLYQRLTTSQFRS
ncbi:MAG: transporter ATP-binding protein [Alphaproteobacteria bacterium]|nr:transporter ATP-binding protein [Alphaproteobacteria bacterium]